MSVRPRKTISVVALRPVVAALANRGADVNALLQAVQLDPSVVDDPEARIASSRFRALWHEAVKATGDEDFGLHAAETVDAGSFDVVGYMGKSSATVRDALRRALRYVRILGDTLELELVVKGGKASLEYASPRHVPRASADYRIGLLIRLARVLVGRDLAVHAIRFEHDEPADTSEYVRTLGLLPQFGCARDALVFPEALLDVPLTGADERLCAILERQAEQLVQRLPRLEGFREIVRREIAAELSEGEVSLTRVADRLGVSTRTLRRRLREENTSHQQLLDELRHHLALRYLDEDKRTVREVAFLLGFADSSAFNKAFRRWTGGSPRENKRPSRPPASEVTSKRPTADRRSVRP